MADLKDHVQSIFLNALDISDEEKRAGFLDEQCGANDALRKEVEELLEHAPRLGNFLDPGAGDTVNLAVSERPGDVIGPYRLLEQIGEGGFGVVFLAEQGRPVRRRVALKVIKPGMDTRQVIARFEAERQALAMMDHPNIAKVLDAGATDTGRPYFVMELVQGVPITEYCDECSLTTHERLELFIAVCQAVQHAHQKGVIHRDIKPTNVLVAMQDGSPSPKIIDFGVAKALNQRLTEHTLTTSFAQMIGTPLYMSPEQAELSPLGADTRSDIYSLGVLLYELLTGTTPFDKDRLHSTPFDELRRILRDEEPPRPSSRLSTLAADLATTVADRRRTDTRRLGQALCGELDWIVMKCLEKDRNRRYETASGLAADIQCHLNNEPVQACPPSMRYHLMTFARRNKLVLAATAIIVVNLTLALGISIWQATLARRAEALAKAHLENEIQARQQASAEASKANAINQLLQQMLESANPDAAKGIDYTVRQMLDHFSAGLADQLKDQPEVEAALHTSIGSAYRRLHSFDKAETHLTRALELRKRLFGETHAQVAESLYELAWNVRMRGDAVRGETLVREALTMRNRLGIQDESTIEILSLLHLCLDAQARNAECEEVARQIVAISRTLSERHPEEANCLHRLAGAAIVQGKFEKAEKLARESVELHYRVHGSGHPETAYGVSVLARALQAQDKLDEAEKYFREAISIFRKQYEEVPVFTLHGLARVLAVKGDQTGLDGLRPLVTAKGHEMDQENWLGARFRGELCADLGDWEKAAASFFRTSQVTPDFESPVLRAYYWHCAALTCLGYENYSDYQEACASLVDQYGSSQEPDCAFWCAWTCALSANSGVDASRAVDLAKQARQSNPKDPDYLTAYGAALFRAGQFEEARRQLEEAAAMYETPPRFTAGTVGHAAVFLAMLHAQLGQNELARQWQQKFGEAKKVPAPVGRIHAAAGPWNRRLTLQLLENEAEEVLRVEADP